MRFQNQQCPGIRLAGGNLEGLSCMAVSQSCLQHLFILSVVNWETLFLLFYIAKVLLQMEN